VPAREFRDACPGILALHPARDGLVARIRLPGGYVTGPQWRALTRLSRDFGDGCLDLTARGNVQVRGVREPSAAGLAGCAAQAGLLPSGAHDRARNLTASPLSGLGDHAPLRDLVAGLDAALIADPELAALPGRFLFAVDDGTGGAGLAASDIGLRQAFGHLDVVIAGRLTGVQVGAAAAAGTVVAAARAAVAQGAGRGAIRVRELADGGESVAAAIGGSLGPAAPDDSARLPLGAVVADPGEPGEPGGSAASGSFAVIVAAPLGRLTTAQLPLIGSLLRADEIIRLATAGRLVIPLRRPAASVLASLARAGLVTSDAAALAGVTACSGLACRQSVADVRAAARPLPGRPRTHWAGCERQCGRPPDAEPVIAVGPGRFRVPGLPEPRPLALLTGPR
jgi:precorrin-3B synthase